MNLWKLWIASILLAPETRADVVHASIGIGRTLGADDGDWTRVMSDGVPQADIAEVPLTFGDSVVLLDVREDDEWQQGHVEGAQHIPMGDVPARIAEIDGDAKLFVMCHLGGRSQRVAQYLARNGFEPINVTGGMAAWAAAGRPVVTDDGRVGTV